MLLLFLMLLTNVLLTVLVTELVVRKRLARAAQRLLSVHQQSVNIINLLKAAGFKTSSLADWSDDALKTRVLGDAKDSCFKWPWR